MSVCACVRAFVRAYVRVGVFVCHHDSALCVTHSCVDLLEPDI